MNKSSTTVSTLGIIGNSNLYVSSDTNNISDSLSGYKINLTDSIPELVQYIDFSFQILGVDLDFEKFKSMNSDERKMLLREIKINKIL